MIHRLALAGSLAGLVTGAVALAPAPVQAAPDDTTPPQVTVDVSPVDGQNGWHRTPVEVTFDVRDRSGVLEAGSSITLGGASSGSVDLVGNRAEYVVTAEGRTTVSWEIVDTEGNTASGSVAVALDLTAPASEPIGVPHYASQDAVVELEPRCSDAGSGLASCRLVGHVTDLGGGRYRLHTWRIADVEVTAIAVDAAGHRTVSTRTVSVVDPRPSHTVALTAPTPDGDNGWHTRPVRVVVQGTAGDPRVPVAEVAHQVDAGVRTYVRGDRAEFDVTGEGTYVAYGSASDARGFARWTTIPVKIDTVAPEVSIHAQLSAEQGQEVFASVACDDETSGLVDCVLTGGVDAEGRIDTSQVGPLAVTARGRDRAGHVRVVERVVQVEPLQVSTTTLTAPPAVTSRQQPRATIVLGGFGALGGTVEVRDGGRLLGRYVVEAPPTLAGEWVATRTVSLPRLAPGSHRLTAHFLGNHRAQPSASNPLEVVSKSPATVTARYVVRQGRHVATVSVRGLDAAAGGIVAIYDGRRKVGTGTVRTGGAVVRLTRLGRGSHRLTVRYLGSGTVLAAISRVTTLRVR